MNILVYVLMIENEYGINVTLCDSADAAYEAAYKYCEEHWDEMFDGVDEEDGGGVKITDFETNRDAVEHYFEGSEESLIIEVTEDVIGLTITKQ